MTRSPKSTVTAKLMGDPTPGRVAPIPVADFANRTEPEPPEGHTRKQYRPRGVAPAPDPDRASGKSYQVLDPRKDDRLVRRAVAEGVRLGLVGL